MKILVTGGAGFIGSHTVDALVSGGHEVRILDNLQKPVHLKGKPLYLASEAEFIEGDVRDKQTMEHALEGVDAVFHLAAYQDYLPDFSTFFHVNAVGTALLYEIIVEKSLPIRKVVVASSQAVAGEGLYKDNEGNSVTPMMRSEQQLTQGQWEFTGEDGKALMYQLTPETVSNPTNSYGMSKLTQEMLSINLGKRYGIPTTAMRYSIVQGPRQSFYNAYSGACRIFCLSLHFDRAPVVYEDGMQVRDFVNIKDVVDANMLVLENGDSDYRAFNVGAGKVYTVLDFANAVIRAYGKDIQPEVSGKYRFGDTRHIISDISALRELGWEPKRTVADSVAAYKTYLEEQTDIEDILEHAQKTMQDLCVVRGGT